jgi:hypothetical protein
MVTLAEPDMNVVVDPPTEDDPEPVITKAPGTSAAASMGPKTVGQIAKAVTREQSSGASPTTTTVAVAEVGEPELATMVTSKLGVRPVVAGNRLLRLRAVPVVTGISVHPEIALPLEFFTVNVAV